MPGELTLKFAQNSLANTLLTAALRDTRMQYAYEDSGHALSAHNGYLETLKSQGITANKLDFVHQTTSCCSAGINTTGGWGTLENINQPTFPLANAPPVYQGLMKYVAQ